jgi:hypothetical protein
MHRIFDSRFLILDSYQRRAEAGADGKTSHMFLAENFECTPLHAIACKSAQLEEK